MGDPEGSERNPYAVPEAPREPHPGDSAPPAGPDDGKQRRPPAYGSPASAGGGASPEDRKAALRTMRSTALLGAAAVTASILLPPLGIVLGVLVIVRAILVRPRLARARYGPAAIVGPIISGAVAILCGGTLTVVLALYWPELSAYRDCMEGANTTIAEDACDAELREHADLPSWLTRVA